MSPPISSDGRHDEKEQKRRRVQRACDECRKKKIKCDGKLPCTHCTIYSYECTFDQPSIRRQNPVAGYVNALEAKCARYQKLLQQFLPEEAIEEAGDLENDTKDQDSEIKQETRSQSDDQGARTLKSMLRDIELNRDARGNVDFRGHSSGTVFVQSICGQLGVEEKADRSRDVHGGAPFSHEPVFTVQHEKRTSPVSAQELSRAVNHNHTYSPTDQQDEDEEIHLPEYATALRLSHLCFDNACVIIQFVHQPTYFSRLSSLYTKEGGESDDDFRSVVYSAIAVGCLFLGMVPGKLGIEDPRLRAFQYYQASKRLFEPLDRANSEILQSLLCQVLFLQSTANMSTCWTYIGTAIRCAQRMGLHRKLDNSFNPVETQLRKKQFWALRNVELYLHAVLGLPPAISGEDFDQTDPEEVDDMYTTEDAIGTQPIDTISSLSSVNAYSRLMTIMQEITRKIYPLEDPHNGNGRVPISHSTLDSLQRSLDAWSQSLPAALRPDREYDDSTRTLYHQSRLLRFTYYHAYVLLYRPYLHYLRVDKQESSEFLVYALRAKEGALGVLKLTEEIFTNMPECFGHWFSIYAAFYAGTVLSYSVLQERPPNKDRGECLKYIGVAKQAMEFCSCSYAAERCLLILEDLSKEIGNEDPAIVKSKARMAKRSLPGSDSKTTSAQTHRRRISSVLKPVASRGTPNARPTPTPKQPEDISMRSNSSVEKQSDISIKSSNSGRNHLDQASVQLSESYNMNEGDLRHDEQNYPLLGDVPMEYPVYLDQQWYAQPQFSVRDTYQPFMDSQHYGYPVENFENAQYYSNTHSDNSQGGIMYNYDNMEVNNMTNTNWSAVEQQAALTDMQASAMSQYTMTDLQNQMLHDGMNLRTYE